MSPLYKILGVNIDLRFYLVFYSLIWVRTLMMISLAPFLFNKPVPRYALVGISVMLSIFGYMYLVPRVPPPLPEDMLWLIMMYAKEIFVGLTIGFAVSIVFHAFESAGQMIDNQRGASLARLLIPQLSTQGSVTGSFFYQLGVVLFIVTGGHLVFLEGYFNSFSAIPLLEFPAAGMGILSTITVFSQITGSVFLIALQLAAPVIIAIFLIDIILGMTNRFAPQINVWQLGFDIRGYLGMLMLFLSLLAITGEMQKYGTITNKNVSDIIKTLTRPSVSEQKETVESEGERSEKLGIPEVKTK